MHISPGLWQPLYISQTISETFRLCTLLAHLANMGVPEELKIQSQEVPNDTAVVSEKFADETLRLVEKYGDDFGPLTPEKEKKLRRKLYLHVMGLLSAINLLLFVSLAQRDRIDLFC